MIDLFIHLINLEVISFIDDRVILIIEYSIIKITLSSIQIITL